MEFMGVARFSEEGELICFCYQEDVEAGLCSCQRKFDCPEAKFTIQVIPGTRPSEVAAAKFKVADKEVKSNLASIVKDAENIKQGLANLEKSIKQNSKFRI